MVIYFSLFFTLADSSLISWNIQTGATHKILNKGGHEGVVLCVAYHPVS
jgi:hypothetical protein